jgi:uncharacterized protein YbcV (DUF1398 family)
MDTHVSEVVHEVTLASDEERISFANVVKALMQVGVERYYADLVSGQKTYYMPNGDFETVEAEKAPVPAAEFSSAGVENAVRAIQRGEIAYREFCARIAAAGCVGYFVSLKGRRAVYYGRSLDTLVEWFPGAKP